MNLLRRRLAIWLVGLVTLLLVFLWFTITQPALRPSERIDAPEVPAERLENHVRALSQTFIPRDWRHAENLDRAAAYIHDAFEAAGARVSEEPFELEGQRYRNVIASFGPEKAERIVVGAHYDAHEQFPAADDNASGVAGLLELARMLSGRSLPVRVDLVAFTLEETRRSSPRGRGVSLYGSAVHAISLHRQRAAVRLMISLEMIGYFNDAEGSQRYPIAGLQWIYPRQGNFIAVCGRLQEAWVVRKVKQAMQAASDLPVFSLNVPSPLAGINRSDHAAFWEAGYPAVLITDTAFNRNPNYHRPTDTPDTLDYRRMAMVVQGVYSAVLAIAHQ